MAGPYNGTVVGSPQFVASPVTGTGFNQALKAGAADGFTNTFDLFTNNAGGWELRFWVATTANTIVIWSRNVSAGNSSALRINAGGHLELSIGGVNTVASTGVYNDGNPHEVRLTFAGGAGAWKVYVDGAGTPVINFSGTPSAATFTTNSFCPNGTYDELIAYNAVLTTAGWTVSTVPYTNVGSTIFHYNFDGHLTDIATDTPPTIGAVSVSSSGGTDTVTYPAATAGTYTISGYALYTSAAAGAEPFVAVSTASGTGGGTFTHASPAPGSTNYYVVRAFDTQSVPGYSSPSNEVLIANLLTLAAPTTPSGTVSTLSGNFTAAFNGTPGSPIVVTPTDHGAGGAFAPSTVTLPASLNPSATFKYTPVATGNVVVGAAGGGYTAANVNYFSYSAGAVSFTFVAPYGSLFTGLGLGYAIYSGVDGSTIMPHTTAGAAEVPAASGVYAAVVKVESTWHALFTWDAPSGLIPVVNPIN